MSRIGIQVDLPVARKRLGDHAAAAAEARTTLIRQFGFPSVGRNGRAARPWATAQGSIHLGRLARDTDWPRSPAGVPLLDAHSLEVVANDSSHAEARQVAEPIRDILGVGWWYDVVATHAHGDRIHLTYEARTATGRWTAKDPNVLGVRKTVTGVVYSERDVVLADEGDWLVGFDYAGLDARVVAGLSGDRAYAGLVSSGDIHAEVAEIFFGDRARRDDAKRITHGLNYGAGPAAVAKVVGCDVDTAEHRTGGFLRRFPQLARWQAELRAAGERGLPLDTGTGRTVQADAGREHTTAPARVAQAAAADIVTKGLLTLEDAGLLDRVRLCVHDELILSWPDSTANCRRAAGQPRQLRLGVPKRTGDPDRRGGARPRRSALVRPVPAAERGGLAHGGLSLTNIGEGPGRRGTEAQNPSSLLTSEPTPLPRSLLGGGPVGRTSLRHARGRRRAVVEGRGQ